MLLKAKTANKKTIINVINTIRYQYKSINQWCYIYNKVNPIAIHIQAEKQRHD